jgi:DNA-binding CsgD family transcriptional regulator
MNLVDEFLKEMNVEKTTKTNLKTLDLVLYEERTMDEVAHELELNKMTLFSRLHRVYEKFGIYGQGSRSELQAKYIKFLERRLKDANIST